MEERREEVSVYVENAMRAYQGTVLNIEQSLSTALARADASAEDFVFIENGTGQWQGIMKGELRRQAT